MLTELEAVELLELKEKCLDSYGKPRTDVTADTEDLVRLAALQEKEEAEDTVLFHDMTAAELKVVAKDLGIKGWANMKKETLIDAIEKYDDKKDEPEGDSTYIKSLEAEGYEYLGKNDRGQYFIGLDKKAYVTNSSGVMSCVGNKFGDKLLKSLKK